MEAPRYGVATQMKIVQYCTHGFDTTLYLLTKEWQDKLHSNDVRDLALKEKEWRNQVCGTSKESGSFAVMGMLLRAALVYRCVVDKREVFSRVLLTNHFSGNGQEDEDILCKDEVIKGTKTDEVCRSKTMLSPRQG